MTGYEKAGKTLCEECVHIRWHWAGDESLYPLCYRPDEQYQMVTTAPRPIKSPCVVERTVGKCGNNGLYFEQRSAAPTLSVEEPGPVKSEPETADGRARFWREFRPAWWRR